MGHSDPQLEQHVRIELTTSGWKPDMLPLALMLHSLERVPRIELGISAWQADVLPLAPYPHLLVRVAGFEPALPPSKGGGWTRLSYTLLVEPRGIEPRIPACKAGVFPLALRPLCFCLYYICILTHIYVNVKHFFSFSFRNFFRAKFSRYLRSEMNTLSNLSE